MSDLKETRPRHHLYNLENQYGAEITEQACCDYLNITADQLLIARALDREKVEALLCYLEKSRGQAIKSHDYLRADKLYNLIELLPTFPTAEARELWALKQQGLAAVEKQSAKLCDNVVTALRERLRKFEEAASALFEAIDNAELLGRRDFDLTPGILTPALLALRAALKGKG